MKGFWPFSPDGLHTHNWKKPVVSAGLILAVITFPVSGFGADDCTNLGDAADQIAFDKQLFVRLGNKWTPFISVSALSLPSRTPLDFYVVVKPISGADRSGVVVVKSNRVARADENRDSTQKIWLIRRQVQADPACRGKFGYRQLENIYEQLVTTRAYEDYHDYKAKDTPALRVFETALRNFHFLYYSGVKGRCVGTDSTDDDQSPNLLTNNRTQFSYDDHVLTVGRYGYSESRRSLFDGYTDHKTIIKRYQTVNGRACVGFKLELDPAEYFIRVNDLEGREGPPSTNRRQPEKHYPD